MFAGACIERVHIAALRSLIAVCITRKDLASAHARWRRNHSVRVVVAYICFPSPDSLRTIDSDEPTISGADKKKVLPQREPAVHQYPDGSHDTRPVRLGS